MYVFKNAYILYILHNHFVFPIFVTIFSLFHLWSYNTVIKITPHDIICIKIPICFINPSILHIILFRYNQLILHILFLINQFYRLYSISSVELLEQVLCDEDLLTFYTFTLTVISIYTNLDIFKMSIRNFNTFYIFAPVVMTC